MQDTFWRGPTSIASDHIAFGTGVWSLNPCEIEGWDVIARNYFGTMFVIRSASNVFLKGFRRNSFSRRILLADEVAHRDVNRL